MKSVTRSWTSIIWIDLVWGKKNILAKEPYFAWIKERARIARIEGRYPREKDLQDVNIWSLEFEREGFTTRVIHDCVRRFFFISCI
jgi:hypothetical protein